MVEVLNANSVHGEPSFEARTTGKKMKLPDFAVKLQQALLAIERLDRHNVVQMIIRTCMQDRYGQKVLKVA